MEPLETENQSARGRDRRTYDFSECPNADLPEDIFKVQGAIRQTLQMHSYPCVGAKAVLAHGALRLGVYSELGSSTSVEECCADLRQFVAEHLSEMRGDSERFASFMAVFLDERVSSDQGFHHRLWYHLSMMRERDKLSHSWSSSVEERTKSAQFAFSFCEQAFFLIGFYPSHPRLARRLPWPAIVFNPHAQFQKLRMRGTFEPMKEKIRQRDALLQPGPNVFLSDHGVESEAKQYSGIVHPSVPYIPSWE